MGKTGKNNDNDSCRGCKHCKQCKQYKRDTKVRDKFVALVNVKTIVTLALTGGFLWLTQQLLVAADLYVNIFVMVIGYYFGTQLAKTDMSTGYTTYDKCSTCPYNPVNQSTIPIEQSSDDGIDPNDPNI